MNSANVVVHSNKLLRQIDLLRSHNRVLKVINSPLLSSLLFNPITVFCDFSLHVPPTQLMFYPAAVAYIHVAKPASYTSSFFPFIPYGLVSSIRLLLTFPFSTLARNVLPSVICQISDIIFGCFMGIFRLLSIQTLL